MMYVRKFLKLSTADKTLVFTSWFLLWAIALGLRWLPFPTLQRLLAGMTRWPMRSRHTDRPSLKRIAWAVTAASRYVPGAKCLCQALAAHTLCLRHGYPAQLQIGVTKGATGSLEAHAWVESAGKIVIGGWTDLSRFTPLPSLERERA